MQHSYQVGDVVFRHWEIVKFIGEGSFGSVYELQRVDFDTTYKAALKVISVPQSQMEVRSIREEGMGVEQTKEYFYSMVQEIVNEFALMSKLKGTGNIVNYEDHEVIPSENFAIGWDILIRMELLTPVLTHAYENPFTHRDVIKLGIDMCKSLELCQKYNIIHRDIKPENIFVSHNGDYKLGDFGIARTVEKTMAGLSKKGTYSYMAPEVYCGLEYGFSVDIYSLGIVLYRLLNKNRTPFLPEAPAPITYSDREKSLAARINGQPMPEPFYHNGRLSEIVLKACAYNPKERYTSPALMRAELEAILYDADDAFYIYPDGDDIQIEKDQYFIKTAKGFMIQNRDDTAEDEKTESIFLDKEMFVEDEKTESIFVAKEVFEEDEKTESFFVAKEVFEEDEKTESFFVVKEVFEEDEKTEMAFVHKAVVVEDEKTETAFASNHEIKKEEIKPAIVDIPKETIEQKHDLYTQAPQEQKKSPVKYIAIGVLILVCVVGGILFAGSNGEGETPVNTVAEEVTEVQEVAEVQDAAEIEAVAEIEEPETLSEIIDSMGTEVDTVAVEAAIRDALNKSTGTITLTDLQSITTLDLSDCNIKYISPLGNLKNLEVLDLYLNNISDISPIEELSNLTYLDLGSNEISDISALAKLTKLTTLRISLNEISDISALAKLTKLTTLWIPLNEISDISVVAKLKNLTTLSLSYNEISDISSLAKLTDLTYLDVSNNVISELSPLAELTNLTHLDLGYNEVIRDINDIEKLTNLTKLSLTNNDISDISVIANLTNLTELNLGDNGVSDISALANLTNLTYLSLYNNNISDINALGNLTNLTSLYLSTNNISDISPLANLQKLENVNLYGNPFTDWSAVSHVEEVQGRP